MCVRSPAAFSSSSGSSPIAAASPAAIASRTSVPSQPSEGMSGTWDSDRRLLRLADLLDPGSRELEQGVELLTCERVPLRRRLHLDQASVAGHDDVEVDVGRRVL